jgi:translation initiation factor 2 beta subunit (eIF-2beta)/eIF-5
MEWVNRNAAAIQAFASILTLILGLAALVGVKLQIDAAERIQRDQSARDIYREYLNLAMNKPEYAAPEYCKLSGTPQEAGYEHFVEYLLYTAEQTISVDEQWSSVFSSALKDHVQYLCTIREISSYSTNVEKLLSKFQSDNCGAVQACG